MKDIEYDALIMVTPEDFARLRCLHGWQVHYLSARKVFYIGSKEIEGLLEEEKQSQVYYDEDIERVGFIDEEEILPFVSVYEMMSELLSETLLKHLDNGVLPRRVAGWYYQQFLKMIYARRCQDRYYLVWDGDTVPCYKYLMFSDALDSTKPCFDLKKEVHEPYFRTMSVLIDGLDKHIEPSFISEHMLFSTEIMKELLNSIENGMVKMGKGFWEKIIYGIYSIDPMWLFGNSFSEYESYGNYVVMKYPQMYCFRSWDSFRNGAEFFNIDTISERDFKWLAKDFEAITFEKKHYIKPENQNIFDNPFFQERLSARKMLDEAMKS